MKSAKELRAEFESKLERLQSKCNHHRSEWMDEVWAPAHGTGRKVLVCKKCEKIIDSKEDSFLDKFNKIKTTTFE